MYPSQQLYKVVTLPPNLQIMNLNLRDLKGHTSMMAEHRSEPEACVPASAPLSPCEFLSLLYFIHFSQLFFQLNTAHYLQQAEPQIIRISLLPTPSGKAP